MRPGEPARQGHAPAKSFTIAKIYGQQKVYKFAIAFPSKACNRDPGLTTRADHRTVKGRCVSG
jgi:hypothetical protein